MNTKILEEQTKQFLKDWEDWAVRAPDSLVAVYDPDAILVATLENRITTGVERIISYYKRIESINCMTIVSTQIVGEVIIMVGRWLFSAKIKPDKLIDARFTFILKQTEDGLKVLHHHSSAVLQLED